MLRISIAFALVFTATGVLQADDLPPGAKWVTHIAKFEGMDKYPDYAFYIYPRNPNGGLPDSLSRPVLNRRLPGGLSPRVPDSGEVDLSGLHPLVTGIEIFLFAIPKKLLDDAPALKEEWFQGKGEGVLTAHIPFPPQITGDQSDKRDKIVTPCKLEIKENQLVLTLINDEKPTVTPSVVKPTVTPSAVSTDVSEQYGSQWQWIVGGGALGLVLMGGLWLLWRRRA